MKDAKFALCSLEGVVIREGITNAKGELYMKALPMGDFILKETEAPVGYTKTDKVFKIHVEKNGDGIPKTSIDGDVEEILTMQNFREGRVGNISISKTVAGSNRDVNKQFEFTVQLKDGSGNVLPDAYTYSKLDKDKKLLEKGSLTSGQTVKLSHSQSMTILDIPKETVYEVSEKDYTPDGYITTISGDAKGKVVADTVKQIYFTNTRSVGQLSISKSVTGNGADKTRRFKFTVGFDGKNADADFQYKGKGVPDGQIKNGGTIELAHGQSIVIEGILEGTSYKVQEEDYTSQGYTAAVSGEKGNISADKVSKVHFVNTKNVPNAQQGGKVQTGDHASVLPYSLLGILAGAVVVSGIYTRRRKNQSET